jgi:pyruvate carboxylase
VKLLVANRGEIAVRILRAAAELGIPTAAVFSEDDGAALHVRMAGEAHPLRGAGPAAYLDADQIVEAAKQRGCDWVHPGYGFLSEQAHFAGHCESAGIGFVGPDPETLAIFGDKTRARALAKRCSVPVLRGTPGLRSADQAIEFLASLGAGATVVIKAVAGGGGRGIRVVRSADEVPEAYARCQSEALQAFGSREVYVEQFWPHVRHVEVQIFGDGSGAVSHLFERECSIQRRHQKLVEIAPCPRLALRVRERLLANALAMARAVSYRSAGTFEFLVDADASADEFRYAFIEANARLQVEHTVTEEVLDVDLVQAQLRLAMGATLAELGLEQQAIPRPRGFAIQVRINAETLQVE